jgi:hypothetical protein
MRTLIPLLILTALSCRAELIPAARLTSWVPGVNVGVPGGIDQYRAGGSSARTSLINVTQSPYNADNTGVSDCSSAIQAAINAATANQVVFLPAGTYRMNSGVAVGAKDNITIRGAGMNTTTIDYRGGVGAAVIRIGVDVDYLWGFPRAAISGSPGVGATVLSMPDTSAIVVGALSRILVDNDPTLPVISVRGFNQVRTQQCLVTAKTSSTITISPALYFALPAAANPVIAQASSQADLDGVEDLTIEMTNSSNNYPGVALIQANACWVYNVRVHNPANYNFWMVDGLKCEFRKCYAHDMQVEGSNRAGFLAGGSAAVLWEDNIVGPQFPSFEMNGSLTGSVVAYNFCYDSGVFGGAGCSINSNHGPHNSFNLYEGNIGPNIQCDGYFGGASDDTVFRNWFHGVNTLPAGARGLTVNLNRFSRNYSVVGNVLGSNDGTSFPYPANAGPFDWGMPNIGNFSWVGTAQQSVGNYWVALPNAQKMVRRGDFATGTAYNSSSTSVDVVGFFDPNAQGGAGILDWTAVNAAKNGLTTWTTPGTTLAVTATASTDVLTKTGHGFSNGQAIVFYSGSGFGGLTAGNTYFVRDVSGATFKLATTLGGAAINITSDGTNGEFFGPDWMPASQNGFQEMDLDVKATLILKGNYDTESDTMESLGGDPLPNSLFRTSKPTWFGNLAWPPIDPANPDNPIAGNADFQRTPAGYRFVNGVDPPPDTGAPVLSSATVQATGTTIVLVMSVPTDFQSGDAANWTFTMSGGAVTMSSPSGSGTSTITCTLSRTINAGETGTIAYSQPGNGVEAVTGGADMVSFSGFTVTNSSTVGGDVAAPTPNPMTFASSPSAVDATSVTMTASTATDATSPPVQYFFDETSGHAGGSDSGWQSSPTYVDSGLSPSTLYTYQVKARDAVGNETTLSSVANVTTLSSGGGSMTINNFRVQNLRVGP